jgi:glycosyltransferase involved in cell wall biosynthesis
MRVCIVTRNIMKGDGQSRVNYEIVMEVLRRGYNVTLLASDVALELQQSSQVTWIDIPVKQWPTQLLSSIAFSWQSSAWLHKHRPSLDVLLVNGANTRGQTDVNSAHFVHTSWLRSPFHPWRQHSGLYGAYHWLYSVLNSYWEKKAFLEANVVIAVSEKVKQELIDIGISSERIQVILNGVDLQEFSPGFANRTQLGLPEDVVLALFVGDIRTSRKNLETLLYALERVPNLHLAVVGDTKKSIYPQLAAKLECSQRIHFLGYRNDISEIMKAADLFVLPSRYEPFGMVLSEAMASGLPVITYETTGAAEIVTPDCGVVLPNPEDSEALAQVLSQLSSNHILRNQMGKAARAIAEKHSWANKAQSYADLFEETIKK